MDTIEQITAFVDGILLEGSATVGSDSPLFSSGLLDSFHLLELLIFIEDRFGVKITPQDIRPEIMDTPRLMANLIRSKAEAALGGIK